MSEELIEELTALSVRMARAEAALSELENADWKASGEGSTRDVFRLQAKRHGVSLARGYVDERLRELEADR